MVTRGEELANLADGIIKQTEMHGVRRANCDTSRVFAILHAMHTEGAFADIALRLHDEPRIIRACCDAGFAASAF